MNVAVDLGGTRVRAALVDDLRLVERREERTDLAGGPVGVTDQIMRLAGEVIAAGGTTWSAIEAMGVSTPGPLDAETGVVFSPPNMPGWYDVPFRDWLQERSGVPVAIVNDANAAALGEYLFGAGRGSRIMVYLTVSTGVGGGVVIGGTLLEGVSGTAGELGHVTIDRHGPRCGCGNIGCLEALASGTAIARRFAHRVQAGEQTALSEDADAAAVARGASEGDPLAVSVFREAAEALGQGVVSFVHAFNPDVVVIGGGVTHAGDLLFGPVRAMVEQHVMPVPRRAVRVVPAALSDDAGLMGATAVARQHAALSRTLPE